MQNNKEYFILRPIILRMSGPYLAKTRFEQTNYKKKKKNKKKKQPPPPPPRTVGGFKVNLTRNYETRHISYAVYIFFTNLSVFKM